MALSKALLYGSVVQPIEGATKRMDEDRKGAEKKQKIVESLTSIRDMLKEVAQNL